MQPRDNTSREAGGTGAEVGSETIIRRVLAETKELRVSGRTNVQNLAWSIVQTFEEEKRKVCLVAIGTQAVNQAVKAISIANSRSASHGIIFMALPAMQDVTIEDHGNKVERTVLKLILVPYEW